MAAPILLGTKSNDVADALAADLRGYETGKLHDETSWLEVALHACRVLNASEKVIFLTSWEIARRPADLAHARDDGYRIVTVPDELRRKLRNAIDTAGRPIVDLGVFVEGWNQSFNFSYVEVTDLTDAERAVFDRSAAKTASLGKRPRELKTIAVSETMRTDAAGTAKFSASGTPRRAPSWSGATNSVLCLLSRARYFTS